MLRNDKDYMRKTTILLTAALLIPYILWSQRDFSGSQVTKTVLLGTGTPNPSPDHSGCSVAVIVNDQAYIVDFGPGIVRRAASLSPEYGGKIKGLSAKNLRYAFLTHLHSDHTTGYPDLILTPWVMGRSSPLEVWGPAGLASMTGNILEAYTEDIKYRIYGDEPGNSTGWQVKCTEIKSEGIIYQDENVRIEAFPVLHGTWPDAWGFRFNTPDRTIVISGDTRLSDKVLEYSKGADILIHEVYSQKGFNARNPEWQKYHAGHHTSTAELGRLAAEAKPGLVVLYHILDWGSSEDELLEEIKSAYNGNVVAGRDLDIF